MFQRQKFKIRTNHHTPELHSYKIALQAAKTKPEHDDAKYKFKQFVQEKKLGPTFHRAMCSTVPAAITLSMFFAIQGMANAPVESMTVAGMGWFPDLTVPDPLYILPILAAGTLALNLKLQHDDIYSGKKIPKDIIFLPALTLLVLAQFPAALNVYCLSTNILTLLGWRMFRLKAIRRVLDLGKTIRWEDKDLPMGLHSRFGTFDNPFSKTATEVVDNKIISQTLDPIGIQKAIQNQKLKKKTSK